MTRKLLFITCALFIFLPADAFSQADRTIGRNEAYTPGRENRLALVIGNSAYDKSPLKNPVNDARLMEKTLSGLGFEVMKRENLKFREMGDAIADFGERLASNPGVGLFYFAGHGIEFQGKNYLIPVKCGIRHQGQLKHRAVDADSVLTEMKFANNPMNIIILDACRNNSLVKAKGRAFGDTGRGSRPWTRLSAA